MRKILIAALVLLLFLASGCTTSTGGSGSKTTPFIGGSTGIAMSFAEGSPPSEVFDGGQYQFDVVVKLENKGEYTVNKDDVTVKISGFLPSQFGVTEADLTKQPSEDLIASEKNSEGSIIKGSPVYVEFNGLNHDGILQGNNEFPIRAEVCYLYETNAIANLCIKQNNVDTEHEGVCEVSGSKTIFNSGGPVQIQNFYEEPQAPNKVRFHFNVVAAGVGEIYRRGSSCDEYTRSYEDQVWVEIESGEADKITCSGLQEGGGATNKGYIRLYEGDTQISCTQEVSTASDYEMEVSIKAVYDYYDDKSDVILVKHVTN
ncbi:hypothetical protein H6504_03140 [Candidatus Woesearchaeota archaeon]|nr:hypothetical protein [Candidatus Woesearchaeota archaeon]